MTGPRYDSIGRILVASVVRERPGAWVDDGLCREVAGDLWFPPKGENGTEAKTICRACTVRMQCLEWAMRNHEPDGIWGGLSRNERAKLRQRKGAA